MTYFDLDKIPPEKIISSISLGISLLRKAYKSAEKLFGKKKADKMLSSVLRELLKKNPDLDVIKARLNSFKPLKPEHSLSDNVQDIVYSENGQDIVNSKSRGNVFSDAMTRVISLAVDTCILRPGSYPGKASTFVL